tara:strand:+ start:630 stop:845 length:216 start_codon:yes stop_codon:yes gene_type:complete
MENVISIFQDQRMEKHNIPGWVSTEEACRILNISYSKFRRNIMPDLDSAQPSGKCGPRYFRMEDIDNLKRK